MDVSKQKKTKHMMCSIQKHFPVLRHISSRLRRNEYQSPAAESTSRLSTEAENKP